MKISIHALFLFLAVSLMSLGACSDDDDGADPNNNNNNTGNNGGNGGNGSGGGDTLNGGGGNTMIDTLFADINGTTIDFEGVTGTQTENRIKLIGLDFTQDGPIEKTITISVNKNSGVGSFELKGSNNAQTIDYEDKKQPASVFSISEGTLEITKLDTAIKRFEGTFNFEALDITGGASSVKVTNGSFEVTYK